MTTPIQSVAGRLLMDNTRRMTRVSYRWRAYGRIAWAAMGRVSALTLARSHFPFLLPDAPAPPIVTVELTNACNVACTYCTSALALRPRGMMTDRTFANLLRGVREAGVQRVRFVGNGEPTLHPRFGAFARAMGDAVPFVSMVTNAQRLMDPTLDAMLSGAIALVEVSVDGGDAASYERSRLGGKFDRLLANLVRLKAERDRRGSRLLINLRLMVRPSQYEDATQLERFWAPYGDTLMRQYVVKRPELDDDADVFSPVQRGSTTTPRCALPFKSLDVTWEGKVPLCHYSAAQIGEPGLQVGNVNESSLRELWASAIMRQYRDAHRRQNDAARPICRGCSAG